MEKTKQGVVTLVLLKKTMGIIKDTSQTLEKMLDATELSKLPKVEDELFYFFVFALDYWIQTNGNLTEEEKRLLRQAFHAHLANVVNLNTVQQRFIAYGQIVNEAKGDSAKFLGFGMKLSEFCSDIPWTIFLVLAPDLFTKALEFVMILEDLQKHVDLDGNFSASQS